MMKSRSLDAEGGSDDRFSAGAMTNRSARPGQRIDARRAEDCATYAAACFQRGVCGIDDGVGLDCGDVTLNNNDKAG